MINILIFCLISVSIQAQTVSDNYVKIFKARVRLVGDITHVNDKDQVSETVTYYDGLGRELQTVDRAMSPLGRDVVTFSEYDGFGKNTTSYLPYVPSEASGLLKGTPRADQHAFYEILYDPDDATAAFKVQVYEHSELGRLLMKSSPGAPWQIATGNVVRKEYTTNLDREVHRVQYDPGGSINVPNGFYREGKLQCTNTIDENGSEAREYINDEGVVICKKVEVTLGVYASTYYVYDDFGNLLVVIQPEGLKRVLDED